MKRYAYLDVLRAMAVLLLVFFHATGFLILRHETTGVGIGGRWIVHSFHMPLFFVLSGFVLGLAARRSGLAKQVRSRWKRLAVPFVAGMVTVIPAIKLVGLYFTSLKPETANREAARLTFDNVFSLHPQHLWFLEYLLFGSLIVLGIWALWRRSAISERIDAKIRIPLLLLLIVAPVAAVYLDGGWEASYQPDTMVPDPALGAYYLCFLAAGWVFSTEDGFRTAIERAPGTRLLIGAALLWASYSAYLDQPYPLPTGGSWTRLAVIAGSVAAAWLVISGLWGLSARLFASPGRRMKLFADSSYWMYIVHLPILVFAESELARTSLPVLVRWVLAIAIATLSCVISYALFVRGRFLGRLLGEAPRRPPVATVSADARQHANETEPGSARGGVRAGDGSRAAPPRAAAKARNEPLPGTPHPDN
ncbi:MAG: acyltransferase [Solirubrobacterales bacterium]